jgi:hypothetical protein
MRCEREGREGRKTKGEGRRDGREERGGVRKTKGRHTIVERRGVLDYSLAVEFSPVEGTCVSEVEGGKCS